MTEAERLACSDPLPVLHSCWGKLSERKLRLFQVACCRRIWPFMPDASCREAIVAAEHYADGEVNVEELTKAARKLAEVPSSEDGVATGARSAAVLAAEKPNVWHPLYFGVALVVADIAEDVARGGNGRDPESAFVVASAEEAQLLLCICGDPLQPTTFAADWRTDTVLTLARQMYESRDFSAMPILADALQDAGCDNADILDHCRGPGPHVRGCWVIDLILGKE